ncbi:MAG: nucleotide exchange factor GrpE [Oculatellaceae cyanobacterium Prado106]|jgi:molecular chaperone GrpE|nr:nucleotide exchange factor GrpE [Oculatellaceae cyanobacterium Prado106]
MVDRQTLLDQLLEALQTAPVPPEPLGTILESPGDSSGAFPVSESGTAFDPYQMVAEWTALRQEMKQQGKLLQNSQTLLQQALTNLQSEQEQAQQAQAATQNQSLAQANQSQKSLLKDLLTIVDALDQASTYWRSQLTPLAPSPVPAEKSLPVWKRWLLGSSADSSVSHGAQEILASNQQGIDLIRRSLLDLLRQRQVIPLEAQGKPFNPQSMYAIGRQINPDFAENTVIQEVVKGYLWGDEILRESQVIVAGRSEA